MFKKIDVKTIDRTGLISGEAVSIAISIAQAEKYLYVATIDGGPKPCRLTPAALPEFGGLAVVKQNVSGPEEANFGLIGIPGTLIVVGHSFIDPQNNKPIVIVSKIRVNRENSMSLEVLQKVLSSGVLQVAAAGSIMDAPVVGGKDLEQAFEDIIAKLKAGEKKVKILLITNDNVSELIGKVGPTTIEFVRRSIYTTSTGTSASLFDTIKQDTKEV